MVQPSPISSEDIETFLSHFDDDPIKAVQAISEYAKQTRGRKTKKSVSIPTGPVLVKMTDVKKTYKVGREHVSAVNGVSLEIHEGEFIALTGASGSGKSTLLQLIGGLDKPSEGTIEVDGTNIGKLKDSKLSTFRGQTIGFVFQFFYLQPFLRVNKNLEVPSMFARTSKKDRSSRLQELAGAVDIKNRLTHFPRELSGGQMQRVAIARALMNRPKILLADEPTGNLDSVNGAAIIDLFETIRREFGTTIIVVTHDAHIASRADREIQLKDGAIV